MNLYPSDLEDSFPEVPKGFDAAMQRAFASIYAQAKAEPIPRPSSTFLPKRSLAFLVAALLLLLTAVSIATGLWRTVFGFSDRYMDQREQNVLPQAHDLAQSNIASFQLPHVRIDIRQAVYDGQELRLIYALTDPSVTEMIEDNPEETLDRMEGLAADGVLQSCDGGYVNGQSIYWDDDKLETSDVPSQVLFYKESILPLWDIVPPDGKFTVTLHLLEGKPLEEQPTFTLDSSVALGMVKKAKPALYQDGPLTLEVLHGSFSPLCGLLTFRFTLEGSASGDETLAAAQGWLTNESLALADGTAMAGSRQGFNPDDPQLILTMLYQPTPGSQSWGNKLFLRPMENGQANQSKTLEVELQ